MKIVNIFVMASETQTQIETSLSGPTPEAAPEDDEVDQAFNDAFHELGEHPGGYRFIPFGHSGEAVALPSLREAVEVIGLYSVTTVQPTDARGRPRAQLEVRYGKRPSYQDKLHQVGGTVLGGSQIISPGSQNLADDGVSKIARRILITANRPSYMEEAGVRRPQTRLFGGLLLSTSQIGSFFSKTLRGEAANTVHGVNLRTRNYYELYLGPESEDLQEIIGIIPPRRNKAAYNKFVETVTLGAIAAGLSGRPVISQNFGLGVVQGTHVPNSSQPKRELAA